MSKSDNAQASGNQADNFNPYAYDKELFELEREINSDLQQAALFGQAGGNHSFTAKDFFSKIDRLVVIRIKQALVSDLQPSDSDTKSE